VTRTIQINEAIEKCYNVIMRMSDHETVCHCEAWLETLKILNQLGFKRVSFEES